MHLNLALSYTMLGYRVFFSDAVIIIRISNNLVDNRLYVLYFELPGIIHSI